MATKIDRRVLRTQNLLMDALIALILEKGYDAITIKDITERADVAYVTFFRHYKDKDGLLMHALKDVIIEFDEPNVRHDDSRVFELAKRHANLFNILLKSPGTTAIRQHLVRQMAKQSMVTCAAEWEASGTTLPHDLLAYHTAVTLLSLMAWWLDNDMPHPPERMAEIYQQLIAV